MIQNYDTNGLVFALRPESVGLDFDSETYKKAILNILDAQKFDCIPLVDEPIIRSNQNNLNDRAIYVENGGTVTHIARRGIYDSEEDIVFISIDNISNIDEKTELIKALESFFAVKKQGNLCHFILSVGGTESNPAALFTMQQLMLERTRKEIFGRMFMETFASKNPDNIIEIGKLIDQISSGIKSKLPWKVISKKLPLIQKALNEINYQNVTSIRQTGSAFASTPEEISQMKIKDVMTKVACGINWTWPSNEQQLPGTGAESELLAKEILCKANDFTNIALYHDNELKTDFAITKYADTPKTSIMMNTDDDFSTLMANLESTVESDFFVIVKPNKNYETSEGPMIWPGIITTTDVKKHDMLITYAAICVSIEDIVRRNVMAKTRYLAYRKIDQKTGKLLPKKSKSSDTGIGTLAKYFRGEKAVKDSKERRKGCGGIYEPRFTFEDLFDTGIVDVEYKLTWVADMRNTLVHEALSIERSEYLPEVVNLRHIKWMYEIANGLGIFDV